MNSQAWLGVVMIGTAIVAETWWTIWSDSRSWTLVDNVPISLAEGSHFETRELPINLNSRYEIQIWADNNIDPDRSACLLGVSKPGPSCDPSSILRARWVVSNERNNVQGDSNSEELGCCRGEGERPSERIIGSFHSQKGQRYKLDVYVLSDSGSLNVIHPRLFVGVADPSLESNLFISGLLRVCCVIVGIIGSLTVLGSLLWQRDREKLLRSLLE